MVEPLLQHLAKSFCVTDLIGNNSELFAWQSYGGWSCITRMKFVPEQLAVSMSHAVLRRVD
jgi:hypothetical protein